MGFALYAAGVALQYKLQLAVVRNQCEPRGVFWLRLVMTSTSNRTSSTEQHQHLH